VIPRVTVGIAVHAEPDRFRATLASVRRTVSAAVQVVAVPDRADAETAPVLAAAGIECLPEAGAAGGAAAFNRLMGGTSADLCVLLESGCLCAPGWLERLFAGLAADARHGLAGPSTNRAWTAQGAEPACAGTDAAVAAAGRRMAARFGGGTRTLEPLHSLGDFCYAVRRAVWEEVGAADEGYGAGPCWEMDYNARAARAGWRGVWVPGAFVWRAPFTPRRAQEERIHFEQNRRRYQDRLCARRLRGEGGGYQPHCRGDACEHFAPTALIQIRIDPSDFPAPLPHPADAFVAPASIPKPPADRLHHPDLAIQPNLTDRDRVDADRSPRLDRGFRAADDPHPAKNAADADRRTDRTADRDGSVDSDARRAGDSGRSVRSSRAADRSGRGSSGTGRKAAEDAHHPPSTGTPSVDSQAVEEDAAEDAPLISCIMPTRGRPELAMQAVRYFLAQDYPRRELIILDDAGGALGALLPADPRIRYEQTPAGETIGGKRNRGVEMARGEIVAQWDDDDWYAPNRLSAQAEPILDGRADVTALRGELFFDLARWEFWTCTEALHRRLFVRDVHGGTLMYRRRVWGPGRAAYPRASLAEDAAFLMQAVRGGARLRRVDTPGLFIYLRHDANAWDFACGRHVDARGWRRAEEPPHLAADRDFYRARSAGAAPDPPSPAHPVSVTAETVPLVSCLMPTADRRRFVPRAIEQFLRQTHPRRELVIVDDGADPVADLVPDDPRVRYHRVDPGASLGEKRNRACALARGDLLAHWDDDDWMSEARLSAQVAALRTSNADVCGLSTVRYFDPLAGRAWEYRWTDPRRPWVGGNTLLYRRAAWERRPFPPLNEGEDTRWIFSLPALHAMADGSWFAALVHGRNTSPKQTRGAHWHPIPLETVRSVIGADWQFYASAGS
jgi:glycosyltransferase involved in cell wall biosynthesis/GT2 family glycosyltransferase